MTAGDVARQEFADTLLLQSAIDGALLQSARDPKARAAVQAAVANGARTAFGIDLRRTRLTDRGLEPA